MSVALPTTVPGLLAETRLLADSTRALRVDDVKKLMKLSDSLARLNFERFQSFDADARRPSGSKQAAFAFCGDTYVGLAASELSKEDLSFAQTHVGILSGLYGLLRPLDAILPYRLEMGSNLKTPRGKNLYEFWGARVAKAVNQRLNKIRQPVVVNLASTEYSSVIPPGSLKARVITPVFKEMRGGKAKIVSFSAKRARGMMARFIVQNRLVEPLGMKNFQEAGYRYQAKASTPDEWLFLRA